MIYTITTRNFNNYYKEKTTRNNYIQYVCTVSYTHLDVYKRQLVTFVN